MRHVFAALIMGVGLAAALGTGCGGSSVEEACQEPYSCPSEDFVDCMPVVAEESRAICAGECQAWVQENCDVEFAF